MHRLAAAFVVAAALAGVGHANGRDPFISTINFKAGDNTKIVAGATFGLLRSDNGGQTFQWYCERAVGYGGTYDPDYAYASSGAVFATTFDGLRVMNDGCSFAATPPGMTFVSHVALGPSGALYFSASDPNDTKIYKSTDGGATFPSAASIAGTQDAWWQTLEVAPSNGQIVYLTGYRLAKKCTSNAPNPGATCVINADCTPGTCEPQKEFLLYRSTDGGASFTPMAMTGIGPTSMNTAIEIAGIDPANADIVYARVTLESATSGESIYRSSDGGTTWAKILTKSSTIGGIAFLVRFDGSCVAGTRDIGAWKSAYVTDVGCGATWQDLVTAPHIGCLYEDSAHAVWACTQNTASVQLGITSDGYGIMKSTDLATWTGVLRFENIQAPVSCPAGTVQEDRCIQRYMGEQSQWCCLVTQLGITSTAVDCTGSLACFGLSPGDSSAPTDANEPDASGGAGAQPGGSDSGCCDTRSPPPLALAILVGTALLLRRRTRRH